MADVRAPYFSDDWLTIWGGDCREVMASMPADSVDCVVTSPPYWGLRDYGTATWEGGDAECDHRGPPMRTYKGGAPDGHNEFFKEQCGKCGAVRIDSQLGLERTPEEYVANMVAVFAEVRRVLKPSGTCWLNLGDSYAGGGTIGRNDTTPEALARRAEKYQTGQGSGSAVGSQGTREAVRGLKPKDLVGIPWRVAFALQADGWYLRSDIIWSKPNPMPESVTDRPTKAHEYLFLLTKSARYYFDADGVRESATRGYSLPAGGSQRHETGNGHGGLDGFATLDGGRNIRSVWNIATRPYPGAHFAVFPPELPERCIKAGSSERGVCPQCGAPWERVVVREGADMAARYARGEPARKGIDGAALSKAAPKSFRGVGDFSGTNEPKGWRSTCAHPSKELCRDKSCPLCSLGVWGHPLSAHEHWSVPAVILDPFAGSGTVGMVANRLSRRAILIDLNPEYLKQQMKRNVAVPLGL